MFKRRMKKEAIALCTGNGTGRIHGFFDLYSRGLLVASLVLGDPTVSAWRIYIWEDSTEELRKFNFISLLS